MGFHSYPGALGKSHTYTTIHFSSVESLQHKYKDFVTMVKSTNCIMIVAWVKRSKEIAGLIEIMNGVRKVASKHLIINIKKKKKYPATIKHDNNEEYCNKL